MQRLNISSAVKVRLIALFVALSLSITYFYIIKPWAMGVPGNSTNFMVFSAMSQADYHLNSLQEVWRPRIGGMWLSGRLVDSVVRDGQLRIDDVQHVFGLYHAVWLFVFFLTIIFLVEDPVFVILGCFAGLFYMLTPNAGYYAYPWDIPSMTFFTLNYLLWKRKLYTWMLPVFAVGHFFKETIAVTAVLYFFTDLNWRKRITYFALAVILTLLVKIVITEIVEGRIIIITQVRSGETHGFFSYLENNFGVYFLSNVKFLFSLQWNQFIFVNAGVFVISLFLPAKTKIEMGTKAVLLVFFCGQMLAGCINEFRLMLEVLPVSVLYLRQTLEGWKVKSPLIPAVENKSSGTLKKKPRP
jgi:hypothetical protein